MRVYTIGELAKSAGVSAPTIRYYEEIGILPQASRSESGQRRYVEADVQRVTFVRRCRDLGFPIEDVQILVSLSANSRTECSGVRGIAQAHLRRVRSKLGELHRLERTIVDFMARCDKIEDGTGGTCAIFAATQP